MRNRLLLIPTALSVTVWLKEFNMEIQFTGEMVTSIEDLSLFRFLLNIIPKPQFLPMNGMMITTNSQYMHSWIIYLFSCLCVYYVCLLHSMLSFSGEAHLFPLVELVLGLCVVSVNFK